MVNKRVISLLAAFGILLTSVNCSFGVSADGSDGELDRKSEMFKAFSILPDNEKKYSETVKRDEFAYYISCLMHKSTEQTDQGSGGSSDASDKYTGYTNDVKREEWVWEGEKTEETKNETETVIESTNTPFYDLRSTDEYYSEIDYVYGMGIMRGSDGYFRPKERLTGYEMVKVMVTLLGAGRYAGDDYPGGYLAAAEKTGLMKELKTGSLDSFVTYGDYVRCLDALLNSHSFKFKGGNLNELVISDNIFREDFLGILKKRGIMDTNGVASVSEVNAEKNYISVDGMFIKEETGAYENLLGCKTDVYYTDDDEPEVGYICAAESNREKLIAADDIVGYNHPYYTYYEGNTTKKIYCGTDTTVMYNGFISESYEENDMVPKTGNVRLIDNNSDGKYEIAFVTNYTTYWVSVNDIVNKIIYDGLNKASINLENYDNVIVHDAYSAAMDVEGIKRNAVLFVAPTKATQKDSCVTIIVSTNTAAGKIKTINKDKISLADAVYELSAEAKTNDMIIGESYTFYLDPEGKIAAWEKKAADELVYGYLVKVAQSSNSLDVTASARIYVLADDSVVTFRFADKVTVNDRKVKQADILGCGELYDKTAKKAVSQVIRYKLNADKLISEIYTPDAVKDKLVTLYTAPSDNTSLIYRESPNAFMGQRPMFYGNKNTVWLYVPKTDTDDTEAYYTKKYKHDDYVYVNVAYGNDEKSLEAGIIVKKTDSAKSKTVDSPGAEVMLVKQISNVSIDGDVFKSFLCINSTGEKEYYLEESSGLADTSSYRIGDLIRLTADANTNKVKSIERVFDCDKMIMTNETSLYGTNPKSSAADMHFVSNTHVVHGVAEKKFNNGEILNLKMFNYTQDASGNNVKDGFQDVSVNIKASMFSVYLIDKERETVTKTTADDIVVDSESVSGGTGTEMVIYDFWGSPRSMYIYK